MWNQNVPYFICGTRVLGEPHRYFGKIVLTFSGSTSENLLAKISLVRNLLYMWNSWLGSQITIRFRIWCKKESASPKKSLSNKLLGELVVLLHRNLCFLVTFSTHSCFTVGFKMSINWSIIFLTWSNATVLNFSFKTSLCSKFFKIQK